MLLTQIPLLDELSFDHFLYRAIPCEILGHLPAIAASVFKILQLILLFQAAGAEDGRAVRAHHYFVLDHLPADHA